MLQFPIDWDYLDIDFEYQDRDRTIPSDTLRSQRTFECESIDPSLWKATTLKVYRNITSIALRAPGVLRWVSWAHKVEAMCFLPDTSNCIKWKKWQWSQMSINALATYYILKKLARYIEAQISAELSLNSKQAYWKHATFKKDSLSICILHLNSLFIQRGPVFQESSIMQLRIGSVHDNT